MRCPICGSPRSVPAAIVPDIEIPQSGQALYVFALPQANTPDRTIGQLSVASTLNPDVRDLATISHFDGSRVEANHPLGNNRRWCAIRG